MLSTGYSKQFITTILLATIITLSTIADSSSNEMVVYYTVSIDSEEYVVKFDLSNYTVSFNGTITTKPVLTIYGIDVELIDKYGNGDIVPGVAIDIGERMVEFNTIYYNMTFNKADVELYYEYNSHILVKAFISSTDGELDIWITYLNSTFKLEKYRNTMTSAVGNNTTISITNTSKTSNLKTTYITQSSSIVSNNTASNTLSVTSSISGGEKLEVNNSYIILITIAIMASILVVYLFKKRFG